jgi:hypothetical protein
MLTTELLITYGFEKVPTTPLEKWSFEDLILFVEKNGLQFQFRIYDVHQPSIHLFVHTEAHFQQIIRTVDEGGSLADYVSGLSGWHICDSTLTSNLQAIHFDQMN